MSQQEKRAEVGLEPPESKREVQVTVDNVKHEVHRGDYIVSACKTATRRGPTASSSTASSSRWMTMAEL